MATKIKVKGHTRKDGTKVKGYSYMRALGRSVHKEMAYVRKAASKVKKRKK